MSILDLFCSLDAFWQVFEPLWDREQMAAGRRRCWRATRRHPSELLTLLILFQQSGYRIFKGFYTQYVQTHLRAEFPHLVGYTRFVELMPRMLVPWAVYLHTQMGRCRGISFVDSTDRPCRLPSRPDSPASRFPRGCPARQDLGRLVYGFKLHLVVNDRGDLLAVCLSASNLNDRRPLPRLVRRLFGDKGYISQALAEHLLLTQGLHLITKLRKNMRTVLLPPADKLLLRKRALIESIHDHLKNICQIEHTRHRTIAAPTISWSISSRAWSPIATDPRNPHSFAMCLLSSWRSLIPNARY